MPRRPLPVLPTPPERQRLRRNLLAWYAAHGRDLPWRRTDDPYHILVSEVMLQQTQVDRVLPKYAEWLLKYPSLAALADAAEDQVAETWRPLGYNIRPRRLHSIARESVAKYGGLLPSDEATLLSFKGIGEYTVGAIRSFAFRERAAILDTNVARVLFRVFIGQGDPKSHQMKKRLWAIAEAVTPRKARTFDFNQALMDFGAMQCPARKPACPVCPMKRLCVTYPWAPPKLTPQKLGPPKAASPKMASPKMGPPKAASPKPRVAKRLAAKAGATPPRGRRRRAHGR